MRFLSALRLTPSVPGWQRRQDLSPLRHRSLLTSLRARLASSQQSIVVLMLSLCSASLSFSAAPALQLRAAPANVQMGIADM